jgi:anti-sigma-K factor RskA
MALTHEELKELLGAYALGALSEDERRAVQAHLRECDECRAEADSYMYATDALAATVSPVPLPAGFAGTILDRVAPPEKQRARPRPSRRWAIAAVGLAAATSLAAIVLAFLFVDARSDLQTNEEVLAGVLQSDEGVALQGSGDSVARVVPTPQGSALVVANLGTPPEEKTYELWFLPGRPEPVSAGTFDPSGDIFVFRTELSIQDYDEAAVTIEPRGGSRGPGPSGPFVLTST